VTQTGTQARHACIPRTFRESSAKVPPATFLPSVGCTTVSLSIAYLRVVGRSLLALRVGWREEGAYRRSGTDALALWHLQRLCAVLRRTFARLVCCFSHPLLSQATMAHSTAPTPTTMMMTSFAASGRDIFGLNRPDNGRSKDFPHS
jgi:hypothetical protein